MKRISGWRRPLLKFTIMCTIIRVEGNVYRCRVRRAAAVASCVPIYRWRSCIPKLSHRRDVTAEAAKRQRQTGGSTDRRGPYKNLGPTLFRRQNFTSHRRTYNPTVSLTHCTKPARIASFLVSADIATTEALRSRTL